MTLVEVAQSKSIVIPDPDKCKDEFRAVCRVVAASERTTFSFPSTADICVRPEFGTGGGIGDQHTDGITLRIDYLWWPCTTAEQRLAFYIFQVTNLIESYESEQFWTTCRDVYSSIESNFGQVSDSLTGHLIPEIVEHELDTLAEASD